MVSVADTLESRHTAGPIVRLDIQKMYDFVSWYFHHYGPNSLLQVIVCHPLSSTTLTSFCPR
jgi:hypothetical protein